MKVDYNNEFHKLQDQCRNLIPELQELILKSEARIDSRNNTTSWGQFIDEQRNKNQFGIYGTSSALQILGLRDKNNQFYLKEVEKPTTREHEIVKRGINFLIWSHDDPNSRSNVKNEFNITYKFCACLDGIKPFLNTSVISLEEKKMKENFVKKLWEQNISPNKKNEFGWGDYFYDKNHRDYEPKVLPTLTTLKTLYDFADLFNHKKYDDALIWCARQLSTSVTNYLEKIQNDRYLSDSYSTKGLLQVEFGLLLLIFNTRLQRKPSFDLGEKYKQEIISHLERILELSKPDPHECYVHPYSVPSKVGGDYDTYNKYIYFIIRPITVLALMENGITKKHIDYVMSTIAYYKDEIIDKGLHVDQVGRAATGDNLWISKCLNKFSNLDEVEIKY